MCRVPRVAWPHLQAERLSSGQIDRPRAPRPVALAGGEGGWLAAEAPRTAPAPQTVEQSGSVTEARQDSPCVRWYSVCEWIPPTDLPASGVGPEACGCWLGSSLSTPGNSSQLVGLHVPGF